MSIGDVIQYAYNAGFRGAQLIEAVAVSLAENTTSNPTATHINSTGTIDRGLWQINSVHGSLSSYDPQANANAAYQLSRGGTDWSPWVTWQTGKVTQFIGQATMAVSQWAIQRSGSTMTQGEASGEYGTGGFGYPGQPTPYSGITDAAGNAVGNTISALTTAANGLAAIPQGIQSELAYLSQPNLGRRVGLVVAGALVLLVGLAGLIWQTGGKQAISLVWKAT